jgi:hypothetical protein
MAPQTTKAWIPTPQITNCLFFGPLRQFVPFKWMESVILAKKNPKMPLSLHLEILKLTL